jgi:hypothetical protein
MFRVFGHDRVWVLDGGLPRWRASGYDVESSASSDAILKASAASEAIEKVYQGQAVSLETIRLYFNDLFPVLELNLTFAFYFKLMCCFLHVHFLFFRLVQSHLRLSFSHILFGPLNRLVSFFVLFQM